MISDRDVKRIIHRTHTVPAVWNTVEPGHTSGMEQTGVVVAVVVVRMPGLEIVVALGVAY